MLVKNVTSKSGLPAGGGSMSSLSPCSGLSESGLPGEVPHGHARSVSVSQSPGLPKYGSLVELWAKNQVRFVPLLSLTVQGCQNMDPWPSCGRKHHVQAGAAKVWWHFGHADKIIPQENCAKSANGSVLSHPVPTITPGLLKTLVSHLLG